MFEDMSQDPFSSTIPATQQRRYLIEECSHQGLLMGLVMAYKESALARTNDKAEISQNRGCWGTACMALPGQALLTR
eukprot:602188-Pelagomonas_calceolata.AAC.4